MIQNTRRHWFASSLGMCAFLAGQAWAADVYQGTVKFENAAGKEVTAKITVTLDQKMPDADRLAIVEQVKSNPDAAKSVLAGKPQLGVIEAGDRHVPIRYAYINPLVEGENLTVISDEPMGFLGGAKSGAPSKKGFDLTYAMIWIKPSGAGSGEIGPAAKIKWMESGAPAPVRYGNKIVWIENVTKTTTP
jgi:hypothetical protein